MHSTICYQQDGKKLPFSFQVLEKWLWPPRLSMGLRYFPNQFALLFHFKAWQLLDIAFWVLPNSCFSSWFTPWMLLHMKPQWRQEVLSLQLFSDVPNTVWTLAPAELAPFVIGPNASACLDSVHGHERPSVAAKLPWQTSPPSFLEVSPTLRCELQVGGSVRAQHRGALHLDPPNCLPSTIANDCSCAFCHVQSTCSWDVFSAARARARVCELWGFAQRTPWARTRCFGWVVKQANELIGLAVHGCMQWTSACNEPYMDASGIVTCSTY